MDKITRLKKSRYILKGCMYVYKSLLEETTESRKRHNIHYWMQQVEKELERINKEIERIT